MFKPFRIASTFASPHWIHILVPLDALWIEVVAIVRQDSDGVVAHV